MQQYWLIMHARTIAVAHVCHRRRHGLLQVGWQLTDHRLLTKLSHLVLCGK